MSQGVECYSCLPKTAWPPTSHKALIEAELELQKKEIIAKLEKGQVLEGTVKNITSYGVFIDLGGVDGLIHITDLSWGRVNHPEEIVQLDQKLNVVILDFDDDKKRIALGSRIVAMSFCEPRS